VSEDCGFASNPPAFVCISTPKSCDDALTWINFQRLPLFCRAFGRRHSPAAVQMTIGGDDEDVDSQTGSQMPASLYRRAVTWRWRQLFQGQRCFAEE
jgi:hypothetical protein